MSMFVMAVRTAKLVLKLSMACFAVSNISHNEESLQMTGSQLPNLMRLSPSQLNPRPYPPSLTQHPAYLRA